MLNVLLVNKLPQILTVSPVEKFLLPNKEFMLPHLKPVLEVAKLYPMPPPVENVLQVTLPMKISCTLMVSVIYVPLIV